MIGNLAVLNPYGDFVSKFLTESFDSKNTKRQYQHNILTFFKVENTYDIKMHMLKATTVSIAKNYIYSLIQAGLSRSSIIQKKSSLSSLFTDIISTYEGSIIISNPWDNISISKMIKQNLEKEDDSPQGYILKSNEIKRLLEASLKANIRDNLIIKIILNCGLRREEVGSIKFTDFFQMENKNGELEWFLKILGKGRKNRNVFVNNDLIEGLNTIGNVGESNKIIFLGKDKINGLCGDRINQIVKLYIEDIGLSKEITAHALRHTNITHLALAGASVQELQKHAGHSSINTTMRYINLINEYENSAAKLVVW